MVGARRLSAVAFRERVENGFGSVVCRNNVYVIPSVGTVSLTVNLFGRDRGHLVTCNRLFRVAVRLRVSRPRTNCTWVSFRYRKGSEDYTSVCGVVRA